MKNREGAELRSRIVEEALAMLRSEGVKAVTMRALARRLGCAASAIYLHFHSKEEILKEVALRGFDLLATYLESAQEIDEPSKALSEAIRRYIDFGTQHNALYSLIFHDLGLRPLAEQFSPEEMQRASAAWEIGREIYARGIAQGVFRAGDPEIEVGIGWALAHGCVDLMTCATNFPVEWGPIASWDLREAAVQSRVMALTG